MKWLCHLLDLLFHKIYEDFCFANIQEIHVNSTHIRLPCPAQVHCLHQLTFSEVFISMKYTSLWIILMGSYTAPLIRLLLSVSQSVSSASQSCSTLCEPMTAAHQASLSITKSQSLLKLMSIDPPNHLIFCHPLLLLPSIFPSIRVFSNESVLSIRWSNYWSFWFTIVLSVTIQGLFPLGLTGLIPLLSRGLLRVFFCITVQKHQFFVNDMVSIGAWIYLWAFYFVPLISIFVFVPVPYCLDDCKLFSIA